MAAGWPAASRRLDVIAHADWSAHAAKRWIAVARRGVHGWRLAAPAPVGPPATLLRRLGVPRNAVLFGIDAPLGLPRAYAEAAGVSAAFPEFLRTLSQRPEFFAVCERLDEVTHRRPFYPRQPRRGMRRAALARALGLADADGLLRAVDRATRLRPAGASPLWTLGANQSGKAALSAWHDLVLPALCSGRRLRLWPFAGTLAASLRPGGVIMAETYPAEAWRRLGLAFFGSKRRQADRKALAGGLRAIMRRLHVRPDRALLAMLAAGFGADAAGEDRFDCTLGVLCLLAVASGRLSTAVPADPWLHHWEGWVLGQTAPPRQPSSSSATRQSACTPKPMQDSSGR
jgi:hypothetical protein